MNEPSIQIRGRLAEDYKEIFTPEARSALSALARFNTPIKNLMEKRIQRREERNLTRQRIGFLRADEIVPGTDIRVSDARRGQFEGPEIPSDLRRQWIQGTGPATSPGGSVEKSLRSAAYALLSGADGWVFDGENALGQIGNMSLDNQRNLKLAIHKDPLFLKVAGEVAEEMNRWSLGFIEKEIFTDWRGQLDFTTVIFRPRGFHLDDRHVRDLQGRELAAPIIDLTLYAVNNQKELQKTGASIVFCLPKIQTAEEAALWGDLLKEIEAILGIETGTLKVYVMIEQLEAAFQLMEIRAALGKHFVGFSIGRWDYVHSVADAMAWDKSFMHPDREQFVPTWGYMRTLEDRIRRAANTPDRNGKHVPWQGGSESIIPAGGTPDGISKGLGKAVAGARREQKAGASGKWVAHWKMVHILRPVWEEAGQENQLDRPFPPLEYTREEADKLLLLEEAPRTVQGAGNLLSVVLQYANAFGQGRQAAALKPADFFGNGDVLCRMEDMATGEAGVSILWEWLHKRAALAEEGGGEERLFDSRFFKNLLAKEYDKLMNAGTEDVPLHSRSTTLPVARQMTEACVLGEVKLPWFIDLLNLNLDNHDPEQAGKRIQMYLDAFRQSGTRITENPDFFDTGEPAGPSL